MKKNMLMMPLNLNKFHGIIPERFYRLLTKCQKNIKVVYSFEYFHVVVA